MAFSCNVGPDVTMVLGSSTNHSDQYGPRGSMAFGYQHGFRWWPRSINPYKLRWQDEPQTLTQIPSVLEPWTKAWSLVTAQAQMSHGLLRWQSRPQEPFLLEPLKILITNLKLPVIYFEVYYGNLSVLIK